VAECHKLILELYDRLNELEAEVAELKRELYGPRRERFIADEFAGMPDVDEDGQVDAPRDEPNASDVPPQSLDNPDTITAADDSSVEIQDLATPETPADETPPSAAPRRRTSSGRQPRVYPADTPREKVYHPLNEQEVPPEILNHPRARRFFRFVREEVELPERRVRILEHYQEVIVVDDPQGTESSAFVSPVPQPLLDRCYVGNSLLAYLAVSRFADHLPYYREEDILRRSGVSIHRATQWRWMRGLARVVWTLANLIRQRVLTAGVLGIDETPCPILDPTLPHTRNAYLYAQYGDDTQPYVSYYFASHKTRANIEAMLDGFQGVLQSDAYICYELITAASLDRIQPAACWAHGRRKFEPLLVAGKHPQATWILREIQKLYDIEDRARDMSDAARFVLRQAESRPIVDRIGQWLRERSEKERPRSALRQGVNYFLNRWTAFTRFLEDGAIPIDNNRVEAMIKGPVMGKKAWLFLGNEGAGETAAIMYTLIMSCKRHCIDPYAYLVDVMARIKQARPDDLESLLPDRWLQTHPGAYVEQRVIESQAAANRKRMRRLMRRAKLAT
jgi:transposase